MRNLIIGLIAGILCTVSFLPQVLKIYRSRNVRDISLATFAVLALGVFLWFIYGLLLRELPIILANGVTFILLVLIVIMKIKYDNEQDRT